MSSSDEYYTPISLFAYLGLTFDLDVAAPIGGIPWIPTLKYYTKEEDGLAQPWEGRVWMNPPYSAPKLWVEKFIEHGNGIALVPMAKSKWFNELWDAADGILPMPTNNKFVREGKPASIMHHTILVAIGHENVLGLENLSKRNIGYGKVR